jgi:ABC-type branched-subunit amino acid transport system ATPase component
MQERNPTRAMRISDRAYIIDRGTIVYEGVVEKLREDRETMKGYLGV